MEDVFMSYSNGQANDTVEQIASELNRAGISCWYMKRDSRYGPFAAKITREIFSCRVFLLILDKRSVQSPHVENEVGLAFSRLNKPQPIEILPVRIADCALSDGLLYYLNRFTITNANPPDEQRIAELVKDIADILRKLPAATPAAPPENIIKSGKCGDNLIYTLAENGVLTISGGGAMRDFESNWGAGGSNAPWCDKREAISRVEIQNGVSSIGERAFYNCAKLTGVVIPPNSVSSIGDRAFYNCAALTSVVIPDGVTSIGKSAFDNCAALTSVTIPDSVTKIEESAFHGCNNLTRVSVPARATYHDAFPPWVSIERRE